MRQVSLLILLLFVSVQLSAVETYAYAQKDTSTLYLDIHRPTAGAETALNGVQKPTILYLFGGTACRNQPYCIYSVAVLNQAAAISPTYCLGTND